MSVIAALPPGAASPTRTSAGLASVFDEGGQGLVELVGVLVRQVDLIGTVVQREGHRPTASEPSRSSTNLTVVCCAIALPSMKGLTGVTADCHDGPEDAQLSCQESLRRYGQSLTAAPPEPQCLHERPGGSASPRVHGKQS